MECVSETSGLPYNYAKRRYIGLDLLEAIICNIGGCPGKHAKLYAGLARAKSSQQTCRKS